MSATARPSQAIHIGTLSYQRDDYLFSLIFIAAMILEILLAAFLDKLLPPKAQYVPKPVARPISELIIKKEEPPPPPPKKDVVKPDLPKRLVRLKEKKKLYSPPPISAIGSPKRVAPLKKKDPKKIVVKKGLLGMISKAETDAELRGFTPSKSAKASEHLKDTLTRADRLKRKDEQDFLGLGNLPEVARKGKDIGYIIDSEKIGEIDETAMEQYWDPTTELPVVVEWEDKSTGGRSFEDIWKVVQSYLGGLNHLYNRSLRRDPSLKGKVTVRFSIAPEGHVTQTDIVSSTLQSIDLEQQIVKKILRWKFPAIPEGTVTVKFPFVFVPPT